MLRACAVSIAAAVILAPVHSLAQNGVGWSAFGPVVGSYGVIVDTSVAATGRASFFVFASDSANDTTWFAGQQILDARAYRGRRVQISASIKSDTVTLAGLWVVVDGRVKGIMSTLASDSTTARSPVRGTSGWRRVSMVIDVAPEAICIRFGPTIRGYGGAWFDAFAVTEIAKTVPATATAHPPEPLKGVSGGPKSQTCSPMVATPTNLDFEK